MSQRLVTLWWAATLSAAPAYEVKQQPARPPAPALVILADRAGRVEAAIAPREGGELASLRVDGRELLYRGNDYNPAPGWRGKAPVLFPAPGSIAEREYSLDGRTFPMGAHGFAHQLPWTLLRSSATADAAEASLEVRDTARTRASYPFGFRLRVDYRLAGGRLELRYTVQADATNRAAMPFGIGNHITFRVSGDRVQLSTSCRAEIERNAANHATLSTRAFPSPVRLSELPSAQAVSTGDCGSEPWLELREPDGQVIRLEQDGDPLPDGLWVRFNLWGIARDGYFSPEPWVGWHGNLVNGRSPVHLAPGKSWRWSFAIR